LGNPSRRFFLIERGCGRLQIAQSARLHFKANHFYPGRSVNRRGEPNFAPPWCSRDSANKVCVLVTVLPGASVRGNFFCRQQVRSGAIDQRQRELREPAGKQSPNLRAISCLGCDGCHKKVRRAILFR
jgi:hypothetical protein